MKSTVSWEELTEDFGIEMPSMSLCRMNNIIFGKSDNDEPYAMSKMGIGDFLKRGQVFNLSNMKMTNEFGGDSFSNILGNVQFFGFCFSLDLDEVIPVEGDTNAANIQWRSLTLLTYLPNHKIYVCLKNMIV